MSAAVTWAYKSQGEAIAEPGADRDLIDERLRAAVACALEYGDAAGMSVDVILVDDETLADLHARFLDDPSPTDVIAFDLRPRDLDLEGDSGPDAEVYVSLDCAQRVAKERGVGLLRELSLYSIHGVLHLCGWDDHSPSDRDAMRAAESAVLDRLGFEKDSLPHDVS